MKFNAVMKSCYILYVSNSLFWYVFGGEIIQGNFRELKPFICDYAAVCATSNPSGKFAVRFKGQCTFECQHRPEYCVGVNYLEMDNMCELFTSNPTDFSETVAGCQYIQVPVCDSLIRILIYWVESCIWCQTDIQFRCRFESLLN